MANHLSASLLYCLCVMAFSLVQSAASGNVVVESAKDEQVLQTLASDLKSEPVRFPLFHHMLPKSSNPEGRLTGPGVFKGVDDRLHLTARISGHVQVLGQPTSLPAISFPKSMGSARRASLLEFSSRAAELAPPNGSYCYVFKPESEPLPEPPISWIPKAERYLFAACTYGQISNRLSCFKNYMLFAAMLNRTLVFPEHDAKSEYLYNLVFNVSHARACLGGPTATIVSLKEYVAARGAMLKVDKLMCWYPNCHTFSGGSDLDLRWPHEVVFPAPVYLNTRRTSMISRRQFYHTFGEESSQVLSLGDVFGQVIQDAPHFYHYPNGPFQTSCSLLVQPHDAIIEAAKGLVRTFMGVEYMAVHLRRGDTYNFWRHCGKPHLVCYLPMRRIAECLVTKLSAANLTVLFASTNAFPSELRFLESLLLAHNPPITLVTLPRSFREEPYQWAAHWNDLNLDDHPLARATLDKLVCAMAKVFLGSRASTFTGDIVSMRAALDTVSCSDQQICSSEWVESLPTFHN